MQGAPRAHRPIHVASDKRGGKPGLGSTPLFITTPSLCSRPEAILTHSQSTLKRTVFTFPFLPRYVTPEEKSLRKTTVTGVSASQEEHLY